MSDLTDRNKKGDSTDTTSDRSNSGTSVAGSSDTRGGASTADALDDAPATPSDSLVFAGVEQSPTDTPATQGHASTADALKDSASSSNSQMQVIELGQVEDGVTKGTPTEGQVATATALSDAPGAGGEQSMTHDVTVDHGQQKVLEREPKNGQAVTNESGEGVTARVDQWTSGDALPAADRAEIDIRKFTDYSMKREHEENDGKWQAWQRLGWDVQTPAGRAEAGKEVIAQLKEQLPLQSAVKERSDQYGQYFKVDVPLSGRNGGQATLKTVWQYSSNDAPPRLVTNYAKVHK